MTRAAVSVTVAAAATVAIGAVFVVVRGPAEATAPAAPTLTKLTRPVTMRFTKSKGASSYLILRNGVVVLTVAANPSSLPTQSVTVRIPCTGNTLSTLRVVARNSSGKSAPSKPSSWRC